MKTEESFLYIRPKHKLVPTEDGVGKVYPNNSAITIAYRFLPEDTDGKWISLGVSFCSPKEKSWSKKKARSIARARLNDSPVRLQYEGLEADLTTRHVVSGLKIIVVENPQWEHADDQVLRPSRFTQRWGAALMGPDGSLLTAYFDFKDKWKIPAAVHLEAIPRPLSHWVLNIPSWARALLET
jgi:hypothetical protein